MVKKETRNKSYFDALLDFISDGCMILTGVALVFLTVIFGWLVFGRYVLNSTPTWVEQLSLLLVVYIGFLGGAVGVHKKTHLGVAVFKELSPEPVKKLFEFITHVVLAGFGLIMTIYGYKLMLFKWDAKIPLLNISEGFRALPIMVSGCFIFLFSIGHLIHFFSKTGKSASS